MIDADQQRRPALQFRQQPVRHIVARPVPRWRRGPHGPRLTIWRGRVDLQTLDPALGRLGTRVVDGDVAVEIHAQSITAYVPVTQMRTLLFAIAESIRASIWRIFSSAATWPINEF